MAFAGKESVMKREAEIVVSNYYRYYRSFVLSNIVQLGEDSGIHWIMPKAGEKGPSLAFDVHLEEAAAEKAIQRLITEIGKNHVPARWLITPDSMPSRLISLLEQNGFYDLSAQAAKPEPGMLLYREDFCPCPAVKPGLKYRKIREKEEFQHWVDVVNTALHGWEMIDAEHYYIWVETGAYNIYLGEINGIPVSTAATLQSGTTASLEFVSTLEEYRHRGAAGTVCSAAIHTLFANGVKTVTLSGSAEGAALYRKLGFHSCFNNIVLEYRERK